MLAKRCVDRMLVWLEQYSTVLQAGVGAVTAAIWIIYLHLLVIGIRRQRRTEILINLAGKRGFHTRCLISNLGFEPIYLLEILVTLISPAGQWRVPTTDRRELSEDDARQPSETTNQGPLKSGDYIDIGSFGDLIKRAQLEIGEPIRISDLTRVEITVVASVAASSTIAAARRTYDLSFRQKICRLTPTEISTRQIRSLIGRRRIKRQLDRYLRSSQ